MEWTNLNLGQSLSPNIILNDDNICWSKDTLQSICFLSKVHLMWPFLCRVDVLPHAAVPESSICLSEGLCSSLFILHLCRAAYAVLFSMGGMRCRWRSICYVNVRWWRCSSINGVYVCWFTLMSWSNSIPAAKIPSLNIYLIFNGGLFFKSHKLWSPKLTFSVLVHDPPCSSASWRQQHC